MSFIPGMCGAIAMVSSGRGDAVKTYLGSDHSAGASPVTFTGKSFGSAAADRYILVEVGTHGAAVSALTVDGNAATHLVTSTNSNYRAAFYLVFLPAGASGNIVVTAAGTTFTHISWHAVYMSSATPHATNTDTDPANPGAATLQNTLNIPAGGVAFAVVTSASTISTTSTWAGLTEDADVYPGTFTYYTAASGAFATAQTGLTISAALTQANLAAMAMVSFGP